MATIMLIALSIWMLVLLLILSAVVSRPEPNPAMRRVIFALLALAAVFALLAAIASDADASPFPRPQGVTVIHANCPGYDPALVDGCAMADATALASGAYGDECRNPQGCIYAKPGTDGWTLWHELGHVWEARTLGLQPDGTIDVARRDRERRWFARRLGRPAAEWFLKPGQRSAGELFAEAYAYCAKRFGYPGKMNRYESSVYGYVLYLDHPLRHRRICTAIRTLDLVRH